MSNIVEFSAMVSNITAFLESADTAPGLNNSALVGEWGE